MRLRRRRSVRFPLLFVILVLVVALVVAFDYNLRPTILAISQHQVTSVASEIIGQVVRQSIVPGVQYQDLVTIRSDNRGKIAFMQYNMAAINRVVADATLAIMSELKKMDGLPISIPLGQAFGLRLFASYGPVIKVLMSPVGSVTVNVKDRFEGAGINQTRHVIYLEVQTGIRMAIPLMNAVANVTTQVPLTAVVIVGDVPQGLLLYPPGDGVRQISP